ncbi:MAG: hypothetical protein QW663_00175 [Nitrososphaerota archaeon]
MKTLVRELKVSGRAELAYELVNQIKDICPPGIEWGFELARLPGVSYIAENGRIVALSISRGEFGPFMDTRMREVAVESIPAEALAGIVSDPESFLDALTSHLIQWLRSSPKNHPLRVKVEEFIDAISEKR